MPMPDFTELSFGYCFLRELEKKYVHGGQFPKAPDFISQGQEAKDGYDVEVAMDNATPLFIQLKRSMVVRSKSATEFNHSHFPETPAYRMKLHSKDQFRQHKALQNLQNAGAAVIYATSQVNDALELSEHCRLGTIISQASAMFEPNEINLPNFNGQHWVSFYADEPFGIVFSKEGRQFERRCYNSEEWLSSLFDTATSFTDNNRKLTGFIDTLMKSLTKDERQSSEALINYLSAESPMVRASYLAFVFLGTLLTFIKPESHNGMKERQVASPPHLDQ